MKPRVPDPSACAALESVAEAASHFAGAEPDEIMRAAPPLVLRALPAVCCVELSMRFADRIGPSVSRAEGWRHRSHTPGGGVLGSTLPMDVRTQDGWAAGGCCSQPGRRRDFSGWLH